MPTCILVTQNDNTRVAMRSDKALQLDVIIQPLRTAKWEAHFHWAKFDESVEKMAADYGGLDLNPDFQRGHVWTEAQQTHFIENCLRGVVASNGYLIQFNCANWNEDDLDACGSDLPRGFQCLDGLQRFTAVARYLRGEVRPFGLHVDDFKATSYDPRRMVMRVAVHDFTQKADLLEHYLALNAGGTPHSESEIARVRQLLDGCRADTDIASSASSLSLRPGRTQRC